MMRAELRRLHSPDVDRLETWHSPSQTEFAVFIQAMIGPEGAAGEEAFNFVVTGPSEPGSKAYRWEKSRLVVGQCDYDLLTSAVRGLCDEAEGETWQDVAASLSRYLDWEFEGYRPYVANSP